MASRTLPNLGLTGFFDLGEDGWDDEMSLNLLTLSALVQGRALSKVAAEPGSPSDGDVHILDETHATQANKVAIRDDGAWVYVTPRSGWLLYNVAEGYYEKFDGSVWAELEMSGGGGSNASAVVTETGTSANLDPDNNLKYQRWTSNSAKTLTVQPESTTALPSNGEWHIRNAGTANLEIDEGSGVTIAPPSGGTLVVPQGGTVTLKRVGEDAFDLLGQTVSA